MNNLARLLDDKKGAVVVILALAISVLAGAIGIAVDSARIYQMKSKLQGAADAAALAAVSEDVEKLSKSERRQIAEMYFHANCESVCGTIGELKVKFEDNASTVVVESKAELPASLSALIGFDDLSTNVEAIASTKKGNVDVYLVLDISESMNIATTDAEIARLKTLLHDPYDPRGCQFACHQDTWITADDGRTYYDVARDNGIELRQDLVREAAGTIIDMLAQSPYANQFRVGVTTFNTKFTVEQLPTADLNEAKTALASIENTSDYTLLNEALDDLEKLIGTNGDGSADNPEKIVVIATDGVHGYYGQHYPIDPVFCNNMKSKGGTQIIAIQLVYPPVDDIHENHFPHQRVGYFVDDLPDLFRECASEGLHFEANDRDSIQQAFEDAAHAIATRTPSLVQ